MNLHRGLAIVFLVILSGCTPNLPDPVKMDSSGGLVDLRTWSFSSGGPVIPQGWLWDADVLWSPLTGRPGILPRALPLGPPDQGGSLPQSLRSRLGPQGLAAATAWLNVTISGHQGLALQIGAFPGAYRVWVNGVRVHESGVLSLDPGRFRPDGAGAVLAVQPFDDRLEIVVEMVTSDPLVRHPELNRAWILGPSGPSLAAERAERFSRAIQATFLFLGSLIFLSMAFLKPGRTPLFAFFGYLIVCLLKLVANVEQAEPLLASFLPGVSPSVYLFLNHGLNLLPFPLIVLFMVRQFPEDVSWTTFLVIGGATLVAEAWELLPFVALALGADEVYAAVMGTPWSFVLNLYVVVVVLYIFERFYHVWSQKRPLAGALFLGGVAIGMIILMPIPLSYFLPVKYTYFLGWGMIVFVSLLGSELVRLQIRSTDQTILALNNRVDDLESLGRLIPEQWSSRLGTPSLQAIRPGDQRNADAIFVQVTSPDPPHLWLPVVGQAADARKALFAEWREGTALWVLDDWPETSLALALEIQKNLVALQGLRFRIVLVKAAVEFHVLEVGRLWWPSVGKLPRARLTEIDALAQKYGSTLVLDKGLEDGLVIGGWRRHRYLTPAGTEIELYEAEEPSLAQIKDSTLDAYESALAQARSGHFDQAILGMVAVVRKNPFDPVARALLTEWSNRRL